MYTFKRTLSITDQSQVKFKYNLFYTYMYIVYYVKIVLFFIVTILLTMLNCDSVSLLGTYCPICSL